MRRRKRQRDAPIFFASSMPQVKLPNFKSRRRKLAKPSHLFPELLGGPGDHLPPTTTPKVEYEKARRQVLGKSSSCGGGSNNSHSSHSNVLLHVVQYRPETKLEPIARFSPRTPATPATPGVEALRDSKPPERADPHALLQLGALNSNKDKGELQYEHSLRRVVRSLPTLSVEVLMRRKALLNELGQLEVVHHPTYQLVETFTEIEVSPLKLYLVRAGPDQERPMMPSRNFDFLEDNKDNKHGYEEPVRDRDKDWREHLWTQVLPTLQLFAEREAQLREEQALVEARAQSRSRKVFMDGIPMNKTLIIKRGVRLGEHACVVAVYGMGIAGRVVLRANRFPRHLRFEAYCPRLEQVFSLRVELGELAYFVGEDRAYLLTAGHKHELCEALVQLLWLDEEHNVLCIGREVPASSNSATLRREARDEERRRRERLLALISAGSLGATLAGESRGSGTGALASTKPWLRYRGLVYSTAMCLGGHYVVVTVHTQPRKVSALAIRAYEPQSSKSFELAASVREIAFLVRDKSDPEMWDSLRRKTNCERAIHEFLTMITVRQGVSALCLDGRMGLPAPSIAQLGPRRKEALVEGENGMLQAAGIAALQQLAANPDNHQARTGARRGAAPGGHRVARRDIGKGLTVFKRLSSISGRECIATCYYNKAFLRVSLYVLDDCSTHELRLKWDLVMVFVRDNVHWVHELAQEPGKGAPADAICNHVVGSRLLLKSRGRGRTVRTEAAVDHTVYCRGHRLRDQRTSTEASSIFCLVKVEQGVNWLKFTAFDRTQCVEADFSFPAPEDTVELIRELNALGAVARHVQLSVVVSTLGLASDDISGATVLRVADDVVMQD